MSTLTVAGLHGAFVKNGFGGLACTVQLTHQPALLGIRLAVKDVFAVKGLICAAGNPTWASKQLPAQQHAFCVEQLLKHGCQWVGKTVTDELTYSLAGINVHYGTPTNPRAPERLPGGSSSGSVVAVAANDADLALGTDCGGSVRLPASYCGVWGMRPSHGLINGQGCFSLAHSLDTVGWFSRDGALLRTTLHRLTHSQTHNTAAPRWLVSEDVLAELDSEVREAFEQLFATLTPTPSRIPQGTLALEHWAEAFRHIQASEIWQQHGDWVRLTEPAFGADIAERFNGAAQITAQDVGRAQQLRHEASAQLGALLGVDGYLLLPPVPGPAPLLGAAFADVQYTRARSQRLLCMAGLAGLPQVVMPWLHVQGAPVGLSLLGPRFSDAALLEHALALHEHLNSYSDGSL